MIIAFILSLKQTCQYTMPKKKGGKSHRKGKKPQQDDRNSMVFREEGEEYAKVTKMLGSGRLEVQLPDSSTKLAIIRGKLRRRRTWINTGDIVLVAIRAFQEDRCDVLFTYSTNQLQVLRKRKVLPEHFGSIKVDDTANDSNKTSLQIDFCESSDDDEELGNTAGAVSPVLKKPTLDIIVENEENSGTSSSDNGEGEDFEFDDI